MDAFLRLLRYARAHRGLIAGAVLAMVVYGAASAALAWLIKPIVDDVLPSQDRLGFVVTALLIAYLLKGLGAYFSSYLMDDIGQRVVRQIRGDLFAHLLNQSAAFFARAPPGSCSRASTTTSGRCSGRSPRPSATSPASRWRSSAMPRCCSTTTPSWRSSA